MTVPLACPNCRTTLLRDDDACRCPACSITYPSIGGIVCFLKPDETFNPGRFEDKQKEAWETSARLRKRIRTSRLLSIANSLRIRFSLSGRRDRVFQRYLRNPGKRAWILDIGCGGGRHYFTRFGHVIGVDPVLELLQEAGELYDAVYQCGGGGLPFPDESFDFVVSTDVIGHLMPETKDALFREMYRVLKRGGRSIHVIETDSVGPWFKLARKSPELFHTYFVERPGHFGLELPSALRQRFRRHGFEEVYLGKMSSRIQEPGFVSGSFDNEYRGLFPNLGLLIALDRLLARSFPVKELLNFLLEPLARIDDLLTPLDFASGVLAVFERPARDRAGDHSRSEVAVVAARSQ